MTPSDHDAGDLAFAVPPPRPEAAVETRTVGGGAVVCALAGDLDIETLAPVAAALTGLLARRPPVIVVDLAGVAFCDSSGLNLLLRIRAEAEREGLRLRLAAVPPTVMRVLELTGARTVFSLHGSVASALES
ncbi:STAS domain-containing protein [Kitasatospora sp. NPDC001547]|uniref:STAS domain-containing protein n=1 Tax=Kitasatospora sp. NPDC001547 TaxID=3364015 RepID=UPI0036A5872C|nr:STAS domain-containing protein [Kitasatospora sp. Xyl93]